jgi:hypothetical protein
MSCQLHDLMKTSSSLADEDEIIQLILADPDALQRRDDDSNLPLHLECKNKCRSAILLKCMDVYPEALQQLTKDNALPLHLLLLNRASSIEDALIMIDKYPEVLKVNVAQLFSSVFWLPIHIECKNRCRFAVLSKCIELYPESLTEAREQGFLPLHLLLSNPASCIEGALKMIEKYPEALRCKTWSYLSAPRGKYLPIHVECKNRCRYAILSKCIEYYPESLSEDNGESMLPLHMLITNPGSLSIDTISMVMCAYPEALQRKDEYSSLPIHTECSNQCRSAILSKCVELYPESLSVTSKYDSFPLHILLTNTASSIEDALMMIEKCPESLRCGNICFFSTGKILPIHIECRNRCRSAVLSKCIEIYPESLSVAIGSGSSPLHMLLRNTTSSIDAALMLIQKYPEALRRAETGGDRYLPIHIECANQSRAAILSKCIEIYPKSLSISGKNDSLPLHLLLANHSSSVGNAFMIIDKNPEALQCKECVDGSDDKYLPLHIECRYRCRPAILSKCIALYPEALSLSNQNGSLPLHLLLSNISSSVEAVTMVIEKCPTAVKCFETSYLSKKYLPIHIECRQQCRSVVLSKFIELYPESLSICDGDRQIPWTAALNGMYLSYEIIYMLRKSLFLLLSAHPAAFYHPSDDPLVNKLGIMQDPRCCRMILNLLPSCLSSAAHLQSCRDLNWQPRYSLLHLWLQLRVKIDQARAVSLEQLPSIKDRRMRLLMVKMLDESSLLRQFDIGEGYSINLGDGIGDLMLRFVVAYL